MTPDEAQALAERTLAAIDAKRSKHRTAVRAADRERVTSDLAVLSIATAGLAEHAWSSDWRRVRDYAADNLRRTARLYGVTS